MPKSKKLTPEEFKQEVERIIVANGTDHEATHGSLDALMGSVLTSLGYGEGIILYNAVPKW